MLTGYNTDVACDGVTYHVQTEDKGLANPIILSLVYHGGTILAAKRTHYGQMVSEGVVDEKSLAAVLERQHQILIAAIRAGKIEQLIKRSAQAAHPTPSPVMAEPPPAKPIITHPLADPAAEPLAVRPAGRASEPLVDFNLDQMISDYLQPGEARQRLSIELLTSSLFVAGEQIKLRAAVLFEGHRPADNATVKLQVVGTRIQAQSFVAHADHQGFVHFTITLPLFTAGTAALILQAAAPTGQEAEIKFLIRRK
jgi:hypothetical protein